MRQGWAALDFGEEREIAQLRRLWDSIELEIIRVLETINQLKESPDYELHRLTTQTPAFFDEMVSRHVASLVKELALLESEAAELTREIEELTGRGGTGHRVEVAVSAQELLRSSRFVTEHEKVGTAQIQATAWLGEPRSARFSGRTSAMKVGFPTA